MTHRFHGTRAVLCVLLLWAIGVPPLRGQDQPRQPLGSRPVAPPSQEEILAEVTKLKGTYKFDSNGPDKRPWAVSCRAMR